MKPAGIGVRYAYVFIFIVLAVIYACVVTAAIGWKFDSRKSIAAFFIIPIALVLLGFAAFGRAFQGRFSLVLATGAFAFAPAIGIGAWERVESPIAFAAAPDPTDHALLSFLRFVLTVAWLVGVVAAAPHVIHIERGLDRIVRILAPVLIVAEVAMFAVAIAHSRRPDPDTFVASLPDPRPIEPSERIAIGGKEVRYEPDGAHRLSCRVVDEANVGYTDNWGCDPASVTFDEGTQMILVRKGSTWSSSKALTAPAIAHRLAAPVGWTHLAGGGALLASIALLLAYAFTRRATAESPEIAPGGYREPASMPNDDDVEARRDELEARARGARAVALTVAASSALPLAAALAHGLGI